MEHRPNLHLIIFKTPFFKSLAHWALLLPSHEPKPVYVGWVFDIHKTAIKSKETEYARYGFTPEIEANVESYHSLNLDVDDYTLNQTCLKVSKDRPFDLVTQNCQHWVYEVIEELIQYLNVPGGDEILERVKALPQVPKKR